MKDGDPPRAPPIDPGFGRDTRLDPMDAVPDATQPGSPLSARGAAALLTPPQPSIAPAFSPDQTEVGHHPTFSPFGAPQAPFGAPQAPFGAPQAPFGQPTPFGVPPPAPSRPKEISPAEQAAIFPDADPIGVSMQVDAVRPSDLPPADVFRAPAPRLRKGWPFLPLGPLVVVIVGFAVALGIGLVGFDQLSRAGDEHAAARAELLAATVSARLAALPASRRLDATQLAARRSSSELVVVSPQGQIIHDATLGTPDPIALKTMLATGHGVAEIRSMGRARYAVRPIGAATDTNAARLVVLVPEPRASEGTTALASALAALVVLLLGVAAGVAYAVSRDITRDLDFLTDRVRTMAQVRTEPTGELVPARTMDEVGIITATFNKLVGRFGLAEKAYRQDLARASAADRERAAFLAAISHELRSPLNAILGFADILMEEVDGPLSPSAREEVEQIRGSGAHLLTLINDILEFSALESNQLRLSRSRAEIFALSNEVVKEARGLVGNKPLNVRIEGDSVVARVDARRVRQIVGNLVNNAIKFTQQGEVVVRVQRDGGLVAISVRDTGPGISQQDRALIFEEYKQAKGERLRRRGTGLGLAITRRLVMLHHGSINVESELGRGSTFTVRLPIGNVDAPPSRKLTRPPQGMGIPGVPPQ